MGGGFTRCGWWRRLALLMLLIATLTACDAPSASTSSQVRGESPPHLPSLYFGADDGTITALFSGDGAVQWIYTTGGAARVLTASSSFLYAASADGMFYALTLHDGTLRWRRAVGVVAHWEITRDALYLLGTTSDVTTLYALDPDTGAILWRRSASPDDHLAAAGDPILLVHNTQTPVDGPTDGFVTALYAHDGTQRWRYATGGETLGPPTVANGIVYVPARSSIYAFTAATGVPLWHTTAGAYNGLPILASDNVICVTTVGGLAGLSPRDGAVRWRFPSPNEITHATHANDTLYLTAYDRLTALDTLTGKARWSYQGGAPFDAPVVTTNAVYISSSAQTLAALDAATGALRWRYSGAPEVIVLVVSAVVYAISTQSGEIGTGAVTALELGDGAVRWRYAAKGAIPPQPFVVG